MKKIVVVLICLFMLCQHYGCSSVEPVIREERPDTLATLTRDLAELYWEVAAASPSVRSLDGYADVTIRTPRKRSKVYSNIQLVRRGESRMIVTAGVLGWPVADLYFGRDSLYVHDILGNRLFAGKNSEENLKKIIGVPSGYQILSESLLGLVRLDEPVGSIRQVKRSSDRVMYVFEHGAVQKEAVVNPVDRTLTALFIRNVPAGKKTSIYFRKFQPVTVDNQIVQLPQQIELVLSGSGEIESDAYSLLVEYDKRRINPAGMSVRFVRPKKARVMNIEDIVAFPWM